jgi:hypothetical protein
MEKYTSLYSQFLQEHNLVERAFSLQTIMTYSANSAMTDEWESIDALRVKGMQEAKRNCLKFRTGEVPWSPSLQEIMDRIAAWKLMRQKIEGKRVSSQLLRRKLKSASLESRSSASLTESIEALNDAYTELKLFKKQAQLKRISWLEELASARAIDGNRKVATEVRQLEQREKQRCDAQMIRRANGRLRSGGISSVIAPVGENYDWVEVTDKKGIEQALLDENQRRFNQACDTPFMTHPLYNAVGPLRIGKGAQDILNGTFVIPAGTDPYAAKLIMQLKAPDCISSSEPLSVAITTEDHSSGWKRAKERTSSGPSGLQFGHFITSTRDPWILQFEATMTNFPYATGYSPQRWRFGADIMLEKKAGNFRVDKLWAILLYEAGFDQNNKFLGRAMMRNAELKNILAKEQYGSRKKMSAIDQCLNKRLTFDLLR